MPALWSGATLARVAADEPARWTPLAVDAAIAALVCALSLGLLSAGEPGGEVTAAGVALTALATLPLIARRRAPLAVFALTGIAGAVLRVVAAPIGPPLGATVALYTIAAGEPRRPRSVIAVVAFVLVVYVAATIAASEESRSREVALAVLAWGGAWLAGERARSRIAALEQRAQRAERERRLAVAEERMRIARDLHDSAGHAISVILVHAGDGRLRAERDPAGARAAFETIEEVARETVGEIDQLVRVLREDGGEPLPGVAALDGLLAHHRAAGFDVTATVSGARRPLAPAVDQGTYRILQEALTNAARHGGGSAQVHVAFGDGALELAVTNPLGPARGNGTGNGLLGMRERAALLGGSLRADAVDDRFEVQAWLPTAR
jgi:signal transduction histidine kinase